MKNKTPKQKVDAPLCARSPKLLSPKRLIFLVLFLGLLLPGAFAQSVITGTVHNTEGEGLPGVSIRIKGSNSGTTSGPGGSYSINVPAGSVLVFSYIGYTDQELVAGSSRSLNVTLENNFKSMDAAVVVGYGTVKRRDLTGSIATVSSEEINSFPAANVMQALAGRAPGVQVKQNTGAPGAPISIRVRGTNSIVGNNEPLYIVDGFPVSAADVINNTSIRSVEILKDASAIAIYGSRASNGVILITTNRGTRGRSKVTLESSYGQQQVIKKMNMLNPLQYGQYYNELYANMGQPPLFSSQDLASFTAMGKGTVWQDVVFQKAPIQSHTLNIGGGNDKTQFSVTGSLFDQGGIIKNSDYKRYSFNTSVQHEISSKFSVDVNLSMSKNQSDRQLSDQGRFGTSLIGRAYSIPSTLPVYNDDGTYMEPVKRYPFVSEALFSPLDYINETTNTLSQKNLLGIMALSYKIIDGLTLRVSGGIQSTTARNDVYQTKKFQNNPNGMATVTVSDYTSLLNENTLNYTKKFNSRHNLSILGGFTYQDFLTTTLGAGGSSFLSDVPGTNSLGTASVFVNPSTSYTKSVLLSGLGRVNYTYNDRYLFTFSMRADGSSVYSPGNKWGYFPSAAFSWRLSDENFMKGFTALQNVKLRTSWGKAGSQAIAPYSTLNSLLPGSTVFGSGSYTTMAPGTSLAADLKWETTEQINVGLEFEILNGRIQFVADYYRKKTSDLLNAVQLPRTTGYISSLRNVGKVSNNGFEFELNAKVFDNTAFKWDLGLNMSFNRSKVLELYGGQDILAGQLQMIRFTDFANTYRQGQPMGIIYGLQEDGYDDKGAIKYKSATKTKIGDPNPNFIFGLSSAMSFKNLSLSMFFSGSQGNDIINMSAVAFTIDNTNGQSKIADVINNYWTPEHTNAKYPALNNSQAYRFSDRYVEDGSYIRMRNIELAYSIPVEKLKMSGARIFVSGQNLLTLTKYSWVDPDVNSRGGPNSLDQGIDYSTYPSAKSVTVGIRLVF